MLTSHSAHRLAGVLALAVVTTSGAVQFTEAHATQLERSRSSSVTASISVQRLRDVRVQFGLDSSDNAINTADQTGDTYITEVGIPLTAAEDAELRARDSYPDYVNRVQDAVSSLAGFGGLWVDQAHGAILHVQVQQDSAALLSTTLSQLNLGQMPYQVDVVSRSYRQLEDANDSLTKFALNDSSARKSLVDSSIHPQTNSVRVNLSVGEDFVPVGLKQVLGGASEGTFDVHYSMGSWVPQSRNITTPPVYGGEWITGSGNCTMGFADMHNTNGSTTPYALSAGHCGNGYFYQGSYQAGSYIGSGVGNNFVFHTSGHCDCTAIGPLPSGYQTKAVITSNTTHYTYTHTATESNYTPGQKACLSGANYGDGHGGAILCTTTDGTDTSIEYNSKRDGSGSDFTLDSPGLVSGSSAYDGDSGGPWGQGSAFLGIHAATNPSENEMAMSKAEYFHATGYNPAYP